VLFGFAVFLIGTGVFYGLPMPVQPMKAVSAVILTGGLRPGEAATAGVMLGGVLLVLGATGAIECFARLIPQSVSAGLQLGLGLLMGLLGIRLMLETPLIGVGSLALLVLLGRVPYCPAAPITLGAAVAAGWLGGSAELPHATWRWSLPFLVAPTWPEVWRSFEIAVLPQLSLTLTNARHGEPGARTLSRRRRDRERAQPRALLGSGEHSAEPVRGYADVPRRRRVAGSIPLWRKNRPCANSLGFDVAHPRGRARRRCGSGVRDDPDRSSGRFAHHGGNRSGGFTPVVRCAPLMLASDRCHCPRNSRHQSGARIGARMDM